jgi:hypothetical protein
MISPLSPRLQRLGRHAWAPKSVRTLLVVAPALGFFVGTGGLAGGGLALA